MTFAANVGIFSTLPFSTCFVFPLAAHAVYQAFANLQKPIVGLIWSLNCRKCITSQVSAQGGFEKKLKKVFGGFWPRFWDHAAPPCFIGFSGNSPLRSPCYGLFAGKTISPAARSPPPARVLLCADPPPSRPPTHCALRHLSQYVTQRATIARRARALPLCTFPAIARYVTYRDM